MKHRIWTNCWPLFFVFCLLFLYVGNCSESSSGSDLNSDDYYRLLGIERSADNREIRKAFKKLALQLHPDKNPGNQQTNDQFLKINRAYEVLKDEQTRNIYNTHGEKGLNKDNGGWNGAGGSRNGGGNYQRWEYFNENFGIYDNDEEIVTLGQADFQQTISNTTFIWFINFYSGRCSHCHHLAPEWRLLAKQLHRIVRIGAINCQEDRPLCQSEGIRLYPSLILYPTKIRYEGTRKYPQLLKFVLENLRLDDDESVDTFSSNNSKDLDRLLARINEESSKKNGDSRWYLLISCFDDIGLCLPEDTRTMLRYKLKPFLNVLQLNCQRGTGNPLDSKLCDHFSIQQSGLALFPSIQQEPNNYFEIPIIKDPLDSEDSSDDESISPNLIFDRIMSKFPKVPTMDNRLMKIFSRCLHFSGFETGNPKKCLPEKDLTEIPAHTVIAFTVKKDNSAGGGGATVDELEIELKSLIAFMPEVSVLKVYCNSNGGGGGSTGGTSGNDFCNKFHIKKYPSIIAVKKDIILDSPGSGSGPGSLVPPLSYEHYYGTKANAIDLLNFARESFQSKIYTLNPKLFESLIQKPETGGAVVESNDPWLVEFHAPWCPMCKTVLQKIRHASQHFDLNQKNENRISSISFGTIDCTIHHQLCRQYNIMSYPTTLFYNQSLPHQFHHGSGDNEDTSLVDFIQDILDFRVVDLDPIQFSTLVEKRASNEIWAVDFFSPFCQPCVKLGPVWRRLAKLIDLDQIDHTIRVGQLDCARWNRFCNDLKVQAYPTIRLYPASDDREHRQEFYKYNSQDKRNLYMLRSWLYEFFPSSVKEVGTDQQFEKILTSSQPHLVDFYLPWAFSSKKFAPDFIRMSKNLTQVKFVRLNCQRFQHVCEQAYVQYFPSIRLYSGINGGGASGAGGATRAKRQSSEGMEIELQPLDQMAQLIQSFLTTENRIVKDEL